LTLSAGLFSFSFADPQDDLDFDDLIEGSPAIERLQQADTSTQEPGPPTFEKQFSDQDGESSSAAKKRFTSWAREVRPAFGLTPSDLISQSNSKDLRALLKILEDLQRSESPETEDSDYQRRSYEYHSNLLHTQGNLEESGRDPVQISVEELKNLRVQGWGDHQSDRDDVFLVRDFLVRLQENLDAEPRSYPIHAHVKAKILDLVKAGMAPLGSHLHDVKKQAVLESWSSIRNASSIEIMQEFPWDDVAFSRNSLGAMDTAFEYGNTVLTYLEFSRSRIGAVDLILDFASKTDTLERLRDLRDFSKSRNLRRVESMLPERSGPLWVFQMVRAIQGDLEFRALAEKIFETHKASIDQPDELEQHLRFLKTRLDQVYESSSISQAVADAKKSKTMSMLREFSKSPELSKPLDPLVKITSVAGMSLPDAEIKDFETQTGLSFQSFVETEGHPQKIEALLKQSFAGEVHSPQKMKARLQSLEKASKRLGSSEFIPVLLEEARQKKVSLTLKKRSDLHQYFRVDQGSIVFRPASLKWITEGDSSASVVSANQDFASALGLAELQLRSAEDAAAALESAVSEASNLSRELQEMGQAKAGVETGGALDRVREISNELRELSDEVRSDFKAMSSLQDGFRLSRSRLLDLLGLDPGLQLITKEDQLSEAVSQFLKNAAFQDEELSPRVERLFKLLHGVHKSARAIHSLAQKIEKRSGRVDELRASLIEIHDSSQKSFPQALKQRDQLRETHRARYEEVNYRTQDELELLRQTAPMQSRIDGSWATHFAARYLTGYIRKGDSASNHIEKIHVNVLSGNRIEVQITLAHIEIDEKFNEVYHRKKVSLQVVPRVIKSRKNHFDFILSSLSVQSEGQEAIELKTDLGVVLDSTILLMNQLVERLNNTPFKDLRFKYFPHLSTLRVINAIPIFQSFPSFTVSHIELDEAGILVFGGIPGKELGKFLGLKIELDAPVQAMAQKTEAGPKPEIGEFSRRDSQEALESGKVSVRVRQELISNFYQGFRKGFLTHNRRPLTDTSLHGRTVAFFNGLHDLRLRFSDQELVDAWFEGSLQTISKETSDFYHKAMKIIAPVQGFRQGLEEGAGNVIRFLTFGAVEIEVDPKDYQTPSGAFGLYLRGSSSAKDQRLEVSFDQLSLHDTKNPGALQPYIKLAHTAAGAVRLVGKAGDGLKKALNLLPGVDFKISGDNLDETFLNYLTYFLVAQIRQSVPDLDLVPLTYKSYRLGIKDFALIDGMQASIQEIRIKPKFLEVQAKIGK